MGQVIEGDKDVDGHGVGVSESIRVGVEHVPHSLWHLEHHQCQLHPEGGETVRPGGHTHRSLRLRCCEVQVERWAHRKATRQQQWTCTGR